MKWMARHSSSAVVPWRLLGGLFLPAILFTIYYNTQLFTANSPTQVDFTIYILAVFSIVFPFFLAFLCFKGVCNSTRNKRVLSSIRSSLCTSPILLGLGIAIYGLGQVFWLCSLLVTGRVPPYPDPSDCTNFAMYPCYIGAILLLPAPTLSRLARVRILLDGLLMLVAVATLYYYFVLAPLLVHGHGTFTEKLVSGIFMSLDLVLMFCLLLIVLRSGAHLLRPALILLGSAILVLFFIHIFLTYEMLYQGYNNFSKVDISWPLVGIFIVGAARTITNIYQRSEEVTQMPRSQATTEVAFPSQPWKAASPSLLVLMVSLLILAIWLGSGAESFPGQRAIVYIGGFMVLILLILRQLLTLYEVNRLQRQLQVKNRSLSLLNSRLEAQATTDALTGLLNHRMVVNKLDAVLQQARGTYGTCSVIFLDIDKFKDINDDYGHLVGDTVLTTFSAVVSSGLRPGDVVGRWGGEEFVAILPETEPLEALNLAESLRKRVAQHTLAGNGAIHLTCSLGVASYPQDARDREGLITQADRAMYAAKQLGRNQTRTAHELLVQTMGASRPAAETITEQETRLAAETLLGLLEARASLTGQHVRRVAALSRILALALGLSRDEAQLVSLGGLLHEVGTLAIPDALLSKYGPFTEAERTLLLQHPMTGAAILRTIPALQMVAPLVRGLHERIDGLGYPDGLRGEAIPPGTRIITAIDAFDTIFSERSSSTSPAQALRVLHDGAGSQFDPQVVEALSRLLTSGPSRSDLKAAGIYR